MRIGVNTRLLLKGKLEGIGWFSYEILRRLVTSCPEHTFYFFFDRKPNSDFIFASNVVPVVLYPQARHPFLWLWYFESSLPKALKKNKIDLFISTDAWMPLNARKADGSEMPCINVIHDISFEHFSGFLKPFAQLYCKHFIPLFARRANKLITVSEFSKKDISNLYAVDLQQITVVYNAANEMYEKVPEDRKEQLRKKYTNSCPYFIYVGSLHQRKNIGRMLQAFDEFKLKTGLSHKLMIVGNKMWRDKAMEDIYAKLRCKNDVVWMGRVEPNKLKDLVGSAEIMLYVSLFEGFGIPIVEAFAAHTAVITSNVSSMPEVGGDAAEYVDPYSVESITDGLCKLVQHKEYREALIIKGVERAKLFSWDKSAEIFKEVVLSFV